ncbi:MAG: PTS sugar transporter subunit IIA [Pseudomonadota bacterium]
MTIDLSVLLEDGLVLDAPSMESRKTAVSALTAALADKLGLDAQTVFEAVIERENLGSTGVGEGVAIPHARLKGIDKPVGAFMRLSDGVDFDAIDGRPCDLIFMLLAPLGSGADHLRALAQVSRAFRDASLRDTLRKADDSAAIIRVLCPDALSQTAA